MCGDVYGSVLITDIRAVIILYFKFAEDTDIFVVHGEGQVWFLVFS